MHIPIEQAIGNTPLVYVESSNCYAKLEGVNLFGSMKDRAALYTIYKLLESKTISLDTPIIESSSGNFAVSLAGICNCLGISFTCVSDPLMNITTRGILRAFGAKIITIDQPDENNIYVTKRLEYINNLLSKDKSIYWVNQYNSPLIREAYESLAREIIEQKNDVEYIFIPVSSCGTIASVSKFIKAIKPSIKVIAVDLESSSIFYKPVARQKLPGMGFNTQPGNLQYSFIDDVVIVDELSCIIECRGLLKSGLLVGPSSGAVIAAIKKFNPDLNKKHEIVAIFPDRGDRYIDNVYNDKWCSDNYPNYVDWQK